MKDLNTLTYESGVMPTLFAEEEGCAERVVRAIEQTEMPVVEILQRGELAADVFKEAVKIKKHAYIGAGTICTLEHCKQMADLGADFIVSPGYNPEMVDWCVKNNIPIIPGVSNSTEVMMAANAGIKIVKGFPFNELGGERFLEGIAGPFADIKFVITGFLDDRDLHLLSHQRIAAIGGIWMFQDELDHTIISEEKIAERLKRSIEIGRHYRYRWQ